MKKIILTSLLGLLALVMFLGVNFFFFRPFSIDAFYARSMFEFAIARPQFLTTLHIVEQYGIKFHQSRLDDQSEAFKDQNLADLKAMMRDLKEYNTSHFSAEEKNNYDTFETYIADTIEVSDRWRFHNYPLNQLFGIQSEYPSFMESSHQVKNLGDAKDYLARLQKVKIQFSQVLEGLKIREEKGILPPLFVVTKVLDEMKGFVGVNPVQNILYQSFASKLKETDIAPEKQAELLANAKLEVVQSVYPAYQTFIDYFERIKTKATQDDGVWKLPDGDAFYAFALRQETTTDLTPEAIHQIGLREVARIEAEMKAIAHKEGLPEFNSIGQLMQEMGKDPRFLYPDTDAGRKQIIEDYNTILAEASTRMREYFYDEPNAKLEVRRIPLFKEKTAPGGYFEQAAMDGSRPGVFYANLYDIKATPKYGMRTLAYHEGIPGHHFQISLAQENSNLAFFRKLMPFTAYVEGWALYSEQLAWEAGLEKDAFDNLGRLQSELFRSVRLVVDTGIHRKRWTREQAITYMIDHTGMAESDVVAEIERYIVNPGQACAYKLGMLKILALRQRAQESLGAAFDLREFHRVILDSGALPLALMERNVETWIMNRKKAA